MAVTNLAHPYENTSDSADGIHKDFPVEGISPLRATDTTTGSGRARVGTRYFPLQGMKMAKQITLLSKR